MKMIPSGDGGEFIDPPVARAHPWAAPPQGRPVGTGAIGGWWAQAGPSGGARRSGRGEEVGRRLVDDAAEDLEGAARAGG